MLSSIDHSCEYGDLIRHPDEIGGFETQSAYIVVDDADAVLARAQNEGWTVLGVDPGRGLRRARLHSPRPRGAALERRDS